MDQFFNWLINAPVWIQTSLMLVVLLPVCAGVAMVMMRLAAVVVPPSDNERQLLLQGERVEAAPERGGKEEV